MIMRSKEERFTFFHKYDKVSMLLKKGDNNEKKYLY